MMSGNGADPDSGGKARIDDAVWSRKEPDSPCVKICVIQPATGFCVGCGRTIDEISRWGGMDEGERSEIRTQLDARMQVKAPRVLRPSARRRRENTGDNDGTDS